MHCPFCKHENDKVVDSRSSHEGTAIRRRRECEACEKRYTTYERIEELPFFLIKKDFSREPFDRKKLLGGIRKACEKRPVAPAQIEAIADELERVFHEKYEREAPTNVVGEFVMQKLSKLDQVAYVRFASVYREFQDANHFMKELKSLQATVR
jgi:transcriptional repressor NrdR